MSASRAVGSVVPGRRLVALLVALLCALGVCEAVTVAAAPHGARALASAATGTAGRFVPVQGRILDTRAAYQVGPYGTQMLAGKWRPVPVAGQVGIPSSGVAAVVVDFTVLNQSSAGHINADKDGVTGSTTVTYMNFAASGQQSNTATIAVGTDGKIQVSATVATDLLIDVQGYYTAGDSTVAGGYVPVTPARLVDTRYGTGLPAHPLTANTTTTVQVSGHVGVPAGASAVMVNIGIADSTASVSQHFIAYAADLPRPATSVNFAPGGSRSFGMQVGLSSASPAGAFDVYLAGSGYTADLIVDVVGYFTAGLSSGAYTPAVARVYDSRTAGHTTLAAGASISIPVAGVAGVPAAGSGIAAVTTNLAVIDVPGTTNNFVQMWADDGTPRPSPASSLNYIAGTITSNMVTSSLGPNGAVRLYNNGPDAVDYVLDVEGWYTNTGIPVPAGQDRTQQSITLQADAAGGGSWVTYKYRVGTQAPQFVNVPPADVEDGNGNHPTWPVAKSSGAFTAYTWNIRDTLGGGGPAPDSLVQVQACYGTSSTDPNPACGAVANIQFAQSAFGDGYATTDLGPGTLAELTGDYQISATDADAATSLGGLSVGRTLTTLAPAGERTDASGVFGPGWSADLSGPDAGDADLMLTDKTSAGYLIFTGADGGTATYQATTSTSSYPISFVGVGDAAADGTTVAEGDSSTITMTDADNTVTTWRKAGSAWRVDTVAQPGSHTTTSYTYNSAGLVTRILAPVPDAVSCTSAPDTTPGCRSLLLTYQSLTVAGVSVTRLANIVLSIPQSSGSQKKVTVAAYDYTSGGLLADAYDPRITPNLKTAYTYTASGRLASLTPPGQAAWSFGYDSTGRLATISRPDPAGSTARTTVVYDVPTTGSAAPISLAASVTGTWDQTADLPVTGTAVFPATHQPAGTTPATVTASDWPYAGIDFLDVNGRTVNTAAYGAGAWQLDTSQYDSNGNDAWDLTAGNRAQALTPSGDTDPYVAELATNVARAQLLASTNVYNPLDPSEVTDTYGPTHPVTLVDGGTADARNHVATSYDEGAPNDDVDPNTGAAYDLQTMVVSDAYIVNDPDNSNNNDTDTGYPDARTTRYGYAAIDSGDRSGWTLYQPTTTTVQMGASPSAADLVTTTRYDAQGRAIETRLPGGSSGGTAQSTDTSYYASTGSGPCVSPAEAGQVCQTTPTAQPSTGDPLPVTTYTYDQYGDQLTKAEAYGSGSSQVVRTTTDTYDAAGRLTTSTIEVSPSSAGGTPIPAVSHSYAPNTGLPITTQTGSGSSAETLTTSYNNVGESTSYTDATGVTSTFTYNLDGDLTSIDDGRGTTSYTYDSASEHRGLITAEDIGVSGSPSAFTASYDADGNLATETYPNGLVATTSYNNDGNPIELAYAKSGSTWLDFTATRGDNDNIVGQTSSVAGTVESTQAYAYDLDDRLTTVRDTYHGGCTARAYGFDLDSNRTTLDSYTPTSTGACNTSSGNDTATDYHYDQADRLTSDTAGSYTYDALGRASTVPSGDATGIGANSGITGALSVSYDANDMVASETQGGVTDTFSLGPLQNRILTESHGTTTTTNHYDDDSDIPTWTSTSSSAWTRNLDGPDGNLAATVTDAGTITLQLPNLRGDITATAADNTTAAAIATDSEDTEYGAPRDPGSAPATYGFLGSQQRSGGALAGLILMGVRLYNPAIGRFLSVDPIVRGSANPYDYSDQEPIGQADPSGDAAWHIHHSGAATVYWAPTEWCGCNNRYEVWIHLNSHPGGNMQGRYKHVWYGWIDVSFQGKVIWKGVNWSRYHGAGASTSVAYLTLKKIYFSFSIRLFAFGVNDGKTLYRKIVRFIP